MEPKTFHPAFVSAAGIPDVNAFARLLASLTKTRVLTYTLAICTILLLGSQCGFAQSFVNLDFENANLTGYPRESTVPATSAFPGWTVNAQYILYDNFSLSGESISIIDTNSSFMGNTIQGMYYAFFEAGNSPSSSQMISLGQTGTIPLGTESVKFWGNIGGLQITFAGQSVAFSEISSTPNYNVYGADVSAYAGQTGQLLFTLPAYEGSAALDNIQFSVSPVPEPGTLALFTTSALLLAFRRRRNPMP